MEQVHSGNAKASKLSKSNIVPDDWEDDDELEDHDADHNKQLWDEANTRESRPMPSVIMSRGFSTGNSSASLPFNQPPTVHILKRPLPSASASPANHHTTAEETLQDREARYQAARERIFGSSTQSEHQETSESGNDCFINKPIPASSNSSKVLRELRGPSYLGDNLNDADKGFGDRRLKRSDPSDIQV